MFKVGDRVRSVNRQTIDEKTVIVPGQPGVITDTHRGGLRESSRHVVFVKFDCEPGEWVMWAGDVVLDSEDDNV